jgi:hypothetical protein
VKFGVKGSANFYKFGGSDGSDIEDQKMKVGFNAGGIANIPVSEMFSIQPELLFSNQGTAQEVGGETLKWDLNYINVPVMAQYNNPSGFYAETGPEFGFLMSAKAKFDGESEDIKEFFSGFNLSWGLGAGYKLPSGLGFGARYNLGLTSIADDSDSKVTNNGFTVGLFYMFGGSKK